jgi:hypothetical protein
LIVSNCCRSISQKAEEIAALQIGTNSLNTSNQTLSIDNTSRKVREGNLRNVQINFEATSVNKRLKGLNNVVRKNYGII